MTWIKSRIFFRGANFQPIQFLCAGYFLSKIPKGVIIINIFAYVRVSDVSQKDFRQLDAMEARGIPPERIFSEKLSGKDENRPALKALMNMVQKGDTVVVESISRFARNTKDLLTLVDKLTSNGVEFISLKENIDTTTICGRFMLTVFAAFAELERGYILQRSKEGIAAAKARGVKFGRPTKMPPENFGEIVEQWEKGNIPYEEVLRRTGLKHTTFYCRLREYRSTIKK